MATWLQITTKLRDKIILQNGKGEIIITPEEAGIASDFGITVIAWLHRTYPHIAVLVRGQ